MQTLIIYHTKYSFTETCVDEISKRLSHETITRVNILKDNIPDLESYDHIIIGGPIYMGMLTGKLKNFCNTNKEILLHKKLALFITCSSTGEVAENQIQNNFDKELIDHAVVTEYLGGALNLQEASFFHKLIIKMVSSSKENADTERSEGLLDDHLDNFIHTYSQSAS